MKKGWEYKKLGEIAKICLGLTHTPRYQECGIPFISVKDISNGDLDFKDTKFISKKEFDSMPDGAKPQKGDILFCRVGTIGKPQILKTDIPFGIFVSVGFLRIIDKSLTEFIKYWMESPLFYKQVRDNVQGSTIKNLNTGWLKKFIVPIPPLSEQQTIVDYLDSAFAKIDAMKANAEKALNEAKALFQASLKEMLEPKEGWEEKKVGDVAEIKGGKRLPKGEKLLSEPTNHMYIRVADFNEYGTVDLDDIQYISDKVYEQIKRYIIKKEDIYVSIAGTIGKSGIVPEELDGANLTENACRLILSRELNQRFMYYMTISPEFIRQEMESTKISAQPKLALTRLADILIAFPSLSEQQSIVETLDSLKSKVDRLQANYDKISQECDALKQAILREVFE
jgi:type I restriction enzyme S subunit